MLQDRFRKKSRRSFEGNNTSLETVSIADQVPQVDDVLAEVDRALRLAQELEANVRRQDRCGC